MYQVELGGIAPVSPGACPQTAAGIFCQAFYLVDARELLPLTLPVIIIQFFISKPNSSLRIYCQAIITVLVMLKTGRWKRDGFNITVLDFDFEYSTPLVQVRRITVNAVFSIGIGLPDIVYDFITRCGAVVGPLLAVDIVPG